MIGLGTLTLTTMGPTGILLGGLLFAADRLSGVLMPALMVAGAVSSVLFYPMVAVFFLRRRWPRFSLAVQWGQLASGAVFWLLWVLADQLCGLSFVCL